MLKHIATELFDIAYVEQGDPNGWPVVLLHGFPYDIHAYDEVAPRLTSEGARVITPYLRGYGPTRFLSPTTLRSGQQAALGADLLALLDALQIGQAIPGGYDWGRPGGMYCGGALSIKSTGAGLGQRVPHPEHSQRPAARRSRKRIPDVVPVLPSWRARPGRGDPEPVRVLSSSMVSVVAKVACRRRRLRAFGRGVRQSRFRRCGSPFLSTPFRTGRRRSSVRECRTQTLCDAVNHSAHDHAGGGRRRGLAMRGQRGKLETLHRTSREPGRG